MGEAVACHLRVEEEGAANPHPLATCSTHSTPRHATEHSTTCRAWSPSRYIHNPMQHLKFSPSTPTPTPRQLLCSCTLPVPNKQPSFLSSAPQPAHPHPTLGPPYAHPALNNTRSLAPRSLAPTQHQPLGCLLPVLGAQQYCLERVKLLERLLDTYSASSEQQAAMHVTQRCNTHKQTHCP